MDDSLTGSIGLLHRVILLLEGIKLSLEVEVFLFLHDLTILADCVILGEEALSLVVNEVTEDLERVLLFDALAFKQLSNLGDTGPDILQLAILIIYLPLEHRYLVESLFHISMAFLGLILKIFNELHQVSSLTDQLLIGHPLLLVLVLERVKLLLKIWVSLLHHWHRIELSWNHLGIWVFITRLS